MESTTHFHELTDVLHENAPSEEHAATEMTFAVSASFIAVGCGPALAWNCIWVSVAFFQEKLGDGVLAELGFATNSCVLIGMLLYAALRTRWPAARLPVLGALLYQGALCTALPLWVYFRGDNGIAPAMILSAAALNGLVMGLSHGAVSDTAGLFPGSRANTLGMVGTGIATLIPTLVQLAITLSAGASVAAQMAARRSAIYVVFPGAVIGIVSAAVAWIAITRVPLFVHAAAAKRARYALAPRCTERCARPAQYAYGAGSDARACAGVEAAAEDGEDQPVGVGVEDAQHNPLAGLRINVQRAGSTAVCPLHYAGPVGMRVAFHLTVLFLTAVVSTVVLAVSPRVPPVDKTSAWWELNMSSLIANEYNVLCFAGTVAASSERLQRAARRYHAVIVLALLRVGFIIPVALYLHFGVSYYPLPLYAVAALTSGFVLVTESAHCQNICGASPRTVHLCSYVAMLTWTTTQGGIVVGNAVGIGYTLIYGDAPR